MTEASQSIHTLIYPFTGLATNHCPENGLSHLRIMESPNVHIISAQFVGHCYFTQMNTDSQLLSFMKEFQQVLIYLFTDY